MLISRRFHFPRILADLKNRAPQSATNSAGQPLDLNQSKPTPHLNPTSYPVSSARSTNITVAEAEHEEEQRIALVRSELRASEQEVQAMVEAQLALAGTALDAGPFLLVVRCNCGC